MINNQTCVRCVNDKTVKKISFDKDGICSHCTCYDRYRERLSDYENLESIFLKKLRREGEYDYDVALGFSGGKDSTLAMYTAMQMGHDIPYIVTIRPADKASWVFHTPNLSTVPLMAEAMGVEQIVVDSDGTEAGDLESLKLALTDLDVDGVVTGALWSDYQWDRMNLVCGDLGLCVLSPLWRKDQDETYDLMCSSGVDAIIVGVFAEGLDERWLGRHLDMDAKKELLALRERYGISIMGEGGEYESMTLDSPMHAKRLVIEESKKVMERNTGVLDVTRASLSEKDH